jgi:hypothetical protein
VSVTCPACQQPVKLKATKPGRFTPTCPRCATPFRLTVPDDPAGAPEAAPLADAPAGPMTVGAPAVPPAATELTAVSDAPPEGTVQPVTLGGYQVYKLLGRGGMGAVYLARQVSLDRKVAVKVLNPRWAKDPTFVTRFLREAYAAARLVHHNVVQIYDVGEERGLPYFAMEYVQGTNLSGLVRNKGRLDAATAAGYVLQAARGLKYAHDRGMIHRDVKPDNLLLNDQGIVKVADLGLVKVHGSAPEEPAGGGEALDGLADVTRAGKTMGTPAYMAPEQGRNPTGVDARADVYSLGCTLYVLLTGRTPFAGGTAVEVITKHRREPVPAPETHGVDVPGELGAVLAKMLAKDPAERYPDLGPVIADLERFLGVTAAGAAAPRADDVATLEACAHAFRNAPAARLRRQVLPSFAGGAAALVFLFLLLRWPRGAAAVLALASLTGLGVFLSGGVVFRTHLFLKWRELLVGGTWADRLAWGVGALLGAAALLLLAPPAGVLLLVLAAGGLAAAYHVLVERRLAAERAAPLAEAEQLLKALRLRGLREEAVRQFVRDFAGDHWEELFEALFGYDLLVEARHRLAAEGGRPRPRHAAWRDPLVRWVDGRLQAGRESREGTQSASPPEAPKPAPVASPAPATRTAAVVPSAAPVATLAPVALLAPTVTFAPTAGHTAEPDVYRLLDEVPVRPRRRRRGPVRTVAGLLFGPRVRFVIGAVLIAGCLLWLHQNRELSGQITDTADRAVHLRPVDLPREAATTDPLQIPGVPDAVLQRFASFNPGVAGLLLVLSAGWRSPRITLFFVPATALIFLGSALGVPGAGGWGADAISLAAGLAVAAAGFLADRLLP